MSAGVPHDTLTAKRLTKLLGIVAEPDTPEQRDAAWDEIAAELARVSREHAEAIRENETLRAMNLLLDEAAREHETMRDALREITAAADDLTMAGVQSGSVDEHVRAVRMTNALLRADALLADSRAAAPETVECQRCGAEHPADPEVRTYSGCPACAAIPEDA